MKAIWKLCSFIEFVSFMVWKRMKEKLNEGFEAGQSFGDDIP